MQVSLSNWLLLFVIISILSCNKSIEKNIRDIREIQDVEKEFMEKVSEWGMRDAFVYFADDSAVLVRNQQLVRGKKEIRAYFDQSSYHDINLTWEPEFVDVAASGDLAYTYGYYTYSARDSVGRELVSQGIFHTVWKRQKDGSWRYVYD